MASLLTSQRFSSGHLRTVTKTRHCQSGSRVLATVSRMAVDLLDMISLETQTRLSSDQVIAEAERFFGSAGCGLTVSQRGRREIVLTGGGGSVNVTATRPGPDVPTTVSVTAKEWEAAALQFLKTLPSPPSSGRWIDRLRQLFG